MIRVRLENLERARGHSPVSVRIKTSLVPGIIIGFFSLSLLLLSIFFDYCCVDGPGLALAFSVSAAKY